MPRFVLRRPPPPRTDEGAALLGYSTWWARRWPEPHPEVELGLRSYSSYRSWKIRAGDPARPPALPRYSATRQRQSARLAHSVSEPQCRLQVPPALPARACANARAPARTPGVVRRSALRGRSAGHPVIFRMILDTCSVQAGMPGLPRMCRGTASENTSPLRSSRSLSTRGDVTVAAAVRFGAGVPPPGRSANVYAI